MRVNNPSLANESRWIAVAAMHSPSLSLRNGLQADRTDHPDVVCAGPWIVLAALGFGYILDQFFWIGMVGSVPRAMRVAILLPPLVLGIVYIWRAHVTFRRVGTAFEPWKPSTALASNGIYTHTRNPMYQGMILMGVAGAIALRSDWSFFMLMGAIFLIHHGVVLREEQYLEQKFGEKYRAYKAKVPRYGLLFDLK
jgi:protein-S-isoprenylcysteine O-methyltransferase Ste14